MFSVSFLQPFISRCDGHCKCDCLRVVVGEQLESVDREWFFSLKTSEEYARGILLVERIDVAENVVKVVRKS